MIFLFLALIYPNFLSIMYFNISLFQSMFQVIFGASVEHQYTTIIFATCMYTRVLPDMYYVYPHPSSLRSSEFGCIYTHA